VSLVKVPREAVTPRATLPESLLAY